MLQSTEGLFEAAHGVGPTSNFVHTDGGGGGACTVAVAAKITEVPGDERIARSTRAAKPPGSNEEDLVAAARNGDGEAFGELIHRHRGACLKRAMLMIRNSS